MDPIFFRLRNRTSSPRILTFITWCKRRLEIESKLDFDSAMTDSFTYFRLTLYRTSIHTIPTNELRSHNEAIFRKISYINISSANWAQDSSWGIRLVFISTCKSSLKTHIQLYWCGSIVSHGYFQKFNVLVLWYNFHNLWIINQLNIQYFVYSAL